jgi:hypothetical protein
MRARDLKRLKAIAHHEAGHAVARWWLGLRFRDASIIPNSDEGTLGHVLSCHMPKWFDPESTISPRVRLRIEKEIISSFAGQIAQAKFLGRKPRYGMHADNEGAVDIATYVASGETLDAFLHFLFLRSRDLVHAKWREIECVAEALISGRRLMYKDLIRVIDRGLNLPPFPALKQTRRGTSKRDVNLPGPVARAE